MSKIKTIAQVLGSDEEKEELKRKAKAENLTISNYLRKLAGFTLNQSFAEQGNKRAVGNRGCWENSLKNKC